MDLMRMLSAGATLNRQKRPRTQETEQKQQHNKLTGTEFTIQPSKNKPATPDVASEPVPELDFFTLDAPSTIVGSDAKQRREATTRAKAIAEATASRADAASLAIYRSDKLPDDAYTPFSSPDDVALFRRENLINVSPDTNDVPPPLQSFIELGPRYDAKPFLLRNLIHDRFTTPTPIQMQAIPAVLAGSDVLACAPTGTGKTVAYLAPLILALKAPAKPGKDYGGIRAVIVTPTRELALQVERELIRLIRGRPFKVLVLTSKAAVGPAGVTQPNSDSSEKGGLRRVDFLISTPKRLVHEISSGNLRLSSCSHLVLDEADRLLDLGFLEQVDEIIAACSNPGLQRVLFSATFPPEIDTLAQSFMNDPIKITIGLENSATDLVNQQLLFVGKEEGKILAIRQFLKTGGLKPPVLIFVETIDRARQLFHELVYEGINVDVMHGDRTKRQRDEMVQAFREGKIWVLICTELLARGVDFKGVNLVINYDFPKTMQSYIHRIGRTGRAGRRGEAITFFTKDDRPDIMRVVNVMRDSGCKIPEWLLKRSTEEEKDDSEVTNVAGPKTKKMKKSFRTHKTKKSVSA